jgi:hypothetical protein
MTTEVLPPWISESNSPAFAEISQDGRWRIQHDSTSEPNRRPEASTQLVIELRYMA